MEQVIEILQGLLTPVIALVAIYIAYQQWQTNSQRLNLERYDRRLHVYEEVKKILSIIQKDANVSVDDLRKFYTSVSEADFLFGPEIPKYINEIHKRGVNLWSWNRQYRDYSQPKPEGYNNSKVVQGTHDEVIWFTEQFEVAKEKFKKYLDISK